MLKALARLLRTRAVEARTYASAQDFLASLPDQTPDELPDCLIVDLQMPEMNGLNCNATSIVPEFEFRHHHYRASRKTTCANSARPRVPRPIS